MTIETIGLHGRAPVGLAQGAAHGLSLAAAPTFAAMALFTGAGGSSDMLCGAMGGASPLHGMAWMYVLMSVFHLSPWLKLTRKGAKP